MAEKDETLPGQSEDEKPRRWWRSLLGRRSSSIVERLQDEAHFVGCIKCFISFILRSLRAVLLIVPFFVAMVLDVLTLWNSLLASRIFVWMIGVTDDIPPKRALVRTPRLMPPTGAPDDGEVVNTRDGYLANYNIWNGDLILNILYMLLVLTVLVTMFAVFPVLVLVDTLTCHNCGLSKSGRKGAVQFTIGAARFLNYRSNAIERKFCIAIVAKSIFPLQNRFPQLNSEIREAGAEHDLLDRSERGLETIDQGPSPEDGLEEMMEKLLGIELFFARCLVLIPAIAVAFFVDIITLWSGLYTSRLFALMIRGEDFPSIDDVATGDLSSFNIWDGTVILNIFFLIVFDLVLLLSIVLAVIIVIVDVLTLSRWRLSSALEEKVPESVVVVTWFFDKVSHHRKRKYLVAWAFGKSQENTCVPVLFVLFLLCVNAIGVLASTEAMGITFLFALAPTPNPTGAPTLSPVPTPNPSSSPTLGPSMNPTDAPTLSPVPTMNPSSSPTFTPSTSPTDAPTQSPVPTFPTVPSVSPTASPTQSPVTPEPTESPSQSPTRMPTMEPTSEPTLFPTSSPTRFPTGFPTNLPTASPTQFPTLVPTNFPTRSPTSFPTRFPTSFPTFAPTQFPTLFPTRAPTFAQLTSQQLRAVMASRLTLSLGWREPCETCTEGPSSFVSVFDDAICSITGGSSYCATANGPSDFRTYGALDIQHPPGGDGFLNSNDRLYLHLNASSLNCGLSTTSACRFGNPTQQAIYALRYLCVAIGWNDVCSGCTDLPVRRAEWCVDPSLSTSVIGTNSQPGSINTGGAVNEDDNFYVSAFVHSQAISSPLLQYARFNCHVTFGWRDECLPGPCPDPLPLKRGSVNFNGNCFDVQGVDSLCVSKPGYDYASINTDGVVGADDLFYIALTCA